MTASTSSLALVAVAALVAQPAQAQFFGLGKKKSADPAASQPCQPSEARSRRNSIFGALASSIAGSALGNAGGTVASLALPIGSLLSSAIMAKLDCKEQVQAAEATTSSVRGGVGTSTKWASSTRPNVSGTSTVTGESKLADGTSCVTVTDVVIVDGEETTAPKRMCRKPGASGYALAA